MGINPTPFSYKSFTFDGKSTREFGVYITGEGVFNAPERAVEMISIPGRDGEYALDQGHFNNIEVTYRAGIVADSTTDFAEAISNFRNWLASREGYCRLTDEYNTEEYRMAVFKNAIALEHEGLLTGEFDVTFDCKPQRYLAIGEELVEIGAWGNTETAEGEIVTIDASSDTAVKALTVDIVPVQSGSGTPSPDNVRPISGHDDVTVTVADDVDNPTVSEDYTTTLPSTTYKGTLDVVRGVLTVTHAIKDLGTLAWVYQSGSTRFYAVINDRKLETSDAVKPNMICSAYDCISVNDFNNNNTNGTIRGNTQSNTIFLRNTDYTDGTTLATALSGIILCYELATPQTYQLTPQQVELLLGENNIFADSGNVTVEYGHNPTLLTNPTWFPSKPLLEVEGYGDINLGKHKIEVENVPIGDVSLAPGTSFYLENRTQTFSLDADKYNEGDIITVAVDQIGFDYSINTNTSAHAHSTTATDSMSGVTSTVKADTNFWGTSCLFYGTTKPSSITFTAGTSANFVNEVSGRLTIQLETLALRNILYTLTETVSYDATQNTISFSLSSTTSYDAAEVRSAELRNRFTPSKIDGINVFSTISAVDGTVYIDCEVGECWNVNGDVILPLNNVISLGSDLPTLPPGDTEVTYDNTITKVEVQPNYWKV